MSRSGASAIDARSRFIPDATKKTGMKNPYPTASSLVSSEWTSPGAHLLRTTPARNAPSTTSRPNSDATTSSANSRATVRRSVVWDVACSPLLAMDENRARKVSRGRTVSSSATSEHGDQRREAQELPVRAQEDGDPDDRQELTHRSCGHDEGPEPSAEHVVVPQDRQQGSERRRGETQSHRHESVDEADVGKHAGHRDRDDRPSRTTRRQHAVRRARANRPSSSS